MCMGIREAIVFVGLLSWALPAGAEDAVLDWNRVALAATVTAAQSSLPQNRSMAIVQVSVHDAVNAITCQYKTYLAIACGEWGSPDGAAIGAAHRALVRLFPAQAPALSAARAASLAAHGVADTDPGVALGEAIADLILALRSNDGAAQAQFPYTAPNAGSPGVWVPVGSAPPGTPGWKDVTPWVIDLSRFQADGPPPLYSKRYARDYNEIKEIGSLTSATRTDEQTQIARFWLASSGVIWNNVARQLIEARDMDLSTAARALAVMYLAAADAGIACWEAKYTFNFWRPITAIQNGDTDGNPATDADRAWTPLATTPQHPEYLSGHSTISSAMATALKAVFGDEPGVSIVATSPTNAGFERHWDRLSEGVEEVIEARIYSGFHFRTSDEEGAALGRRIGRAVAHHTLRPRHVPED